MWNKCSIRNVFKCFEDPKNPSIGPHLKHLHFSGLWHPNRKSLFGRIKQILFYVIVIYFCNQYIKLFINFNISSLNLILHYAPFHVGVLKACLFEKNYMKWQLLFGYISAVERNQLAKNDKQHDKIINAYINTNRKVSYFVWIMALICNYSIFSEPYQKNEINVNGTSIYLNVFDGYIPFGKEPPGYYVSMAIQTFLGNIVSAYIVGWDTLVVSIMIFFAGQLKITCLYCRMMIDAANLNKSHRNIAECHRFHTTLVEYTHLFNALISPIMFVYLVLISVNLGVNIIHIAQIHDDISTLIFSVVYMFACLTELLLFFWYANEVTVESTYVSYSTFESNWPEANQKIRREVALLGVTTKKIIIFTAGPFNEMSLATYVAILKGSYSFYTLLSSTN